MKNVIKLWPLLIVMVVLYGCKEYCPAYPKDDTDYLPVSLVGQSLRYVIDNDTLLFEVRAPEYTERYERPSTTDNECSAHAFQTLWNDKVQMVYSMSIPGESQHSWSVSLQDKLSFIIYDLHNERSERRGEVLPQWTSPSGQHYTDVLKCWSRTSPETADTLYLSKELGLLYGITKKSIITLLP